MKSEISIKAAIYLRAAELVEIGHCKGRMTRRDGVACEFNDANQYCYHGALRKAAFEYGLPDFDYKGGGEWPMAIWNDRPERTGAEVAAKLRDRAFQG